MIFVEIDRFSRYQVHFTGKALPLTISMGAPVIVFARVSFAQREANASSVGTSTIQSILKLSCRTLSHCLQFLNQFAETIDFQRAFTLFQEFHNMLFLLEFRQSALEDPIFFLLWNHYHAVAVAKNDVTWIDPDTAAGDRHVDLAQGCLGCTRGIESLHENRQSQFLYVLGIPAAAVNHHARDTFQLSGQRYDVAEVSRLGIST